MVLVIFIQVKHIQEFMDAEVVIADAQLLCSSIVAVSIQAAQRIHGIVTGGCQDPGISKRFLSPERCQQTDAVRNIQNGIHILITAGIQRRCKNGRSKHAFSGYRNMVFHGKFLGDLFAAHSGEDVKIRLRTVFCHTFFIFFGDKEFIGHLDIHWLHHIDAGDMAQGSAVPTGPGFENLRLIHQVKFPGQALGRAKTAGAFIDILMNQCNIDQLNIQFHIGYFFDIVHIPSPFSCCNELF